MRLRGLLPQTPVAMEGCVARAHPHGPYLLRTKIDKADGGRRWVFSADANDVLAMTAKKAARFCGQ